jgi:hypothetical protein
MEVPYELIIKILCIAILVYFIMNFMNKTPKFNRVDEGFYGAARGSGHPDCLRTLPESSQLLDVFASHKVNLIPAGQSDASADYNELELLLSKMACLKKDLLAPSGQVNSTRYQAFETAHDRIAVAELCGLCMSQNIPKRDLDIIFATWRDRGKELLRKLCTSANLLEQEVVTAEMLFKKAYDDVYTIATSRCLKTDFSLQNGGQTLGDVGAFESPIQANLRSYDYNYGGLSASGWNSV